MQVTSTSLLSWSYALLAAVLGLLAAGWLHRRHYRRVDDERHRTPGVGWVPVLAVLGTVLAGPFLLGTAPVVLVTYVLALVWALVLAVIDLEVRRLPDALVLPAYPAALLLLAACAVVTGDLAAWLRAAACAGAGVALFLGAALLSPGAEGLGLGDVKLAGVLGALLGWFGWYPALVGLLAGFVLGGLAALFLLVVRRVDRRSAMPFGPAMLLGAYLGCLLVR